MYMYIYMYIHTVNRVNICGVLQLYMYMHTACILHVYTSW